MRIGYLSNPVKFTHEGGTLWIAVETRLQLKIAIKEAGIGISKAQQHDIFEQFKKGHCINKAKKTRARSLRLLHRFKRRSTNCYLKGVSKRRINRF